MRSRHGFTLIELLVVIAIIAILASILFPVFAKAREKARQTTCTSQVRQLATAIMMYTQDNNGRYPGKTWNTDIENYVGSQKIFFCPSDAANDKTQPISYGLGGLLVRTDGTGCNEAQITAPTEVGAIADATPSRAWADGGGLVGGGALTDPTTVDANKAVELDPRHGGAIVGFADGHAKYLPGKLINLKDIASLPGRAFYGALGYGFIKNYGGGLQKVNYAAALSANTITVGGDFAASPLVLAAAEAWAGNGGKWYSRGFKGATSPDKSRAVSSTHYCWAIANGRPAGGGNQLRIGSDAFVIIVSKNCKIPGLTSAWSDTLKTYDASSVTITSLFRYVPTGSTEATGYSANVIQAYTYDSYSGSRAYLKDMVTNGAEPGTQAITAVDDLDMVEKVAADPYGIGYCSAAFADTDKVHMLAIGGKVYPNQNPAYRWLVPDSAASTQYPMMRTLKVEFNTAGDGDADNGHFSRLWSGAGDAEFINGPLYKTSYFWTN